MPIDTLTPSEGFTITDRDVILSGLLADGSEFSFSLNSSVVPGEDFFDAAANLTVTLVPEPATWTVAMIGLILSAAIRIRPASLLVLHDLSRDGVRSL